MTYNSEVLNEGMGSFEDSFVVDDLFMATQSTDVGTKNASSLQNAKEKISNITTDEFLIEAYNSATQLRNTLGDADALIADLAENIRMNVLVVALSCRKDPVGMILSSARAMNCDQEEFLSEAINKLQTYKQALAEG